MSIPDNVKIGGINYEILLSEGLEYTHQLGGHILYQRATIMIEQSMSNERKEQVLIHEILHGIFEEAGYDEQDEDMINRVGKILYQVIKDNDFNFSK